MAVSPSRGDVTRIAAVFGFAVLLRLLLSLYLPPLVDVYYYDTQAVRSFLAGSDPYGHVYAGIPSWLATPGAGNVYAYLPGVFLFLAPFGALWDVRLGLIAADLVVAWSLFALKRRRSAAAAAAFLLAPWGFLFSTSYPNNTLVAMAFLGLALLWEAKGRGLPSSVALGASLASSQFVWFVYPFFLLSALRRRSYADAGVSLMVAAALILPFALWNPSAFFYDTVTFQFSRPLQSVVTPEVFGFNFNPTVSGIALTAFGVAVPALLRGAVVLGILAYLLYRSRNLQSLALNATVFVLATVIILPNDFSWWYLELPFQTFLFWLVISRRGESGRGAGPPANA